MPHGVAVRDSRRGFVRSVDGGDEMTTEEQKRVRIACACGWSYPTDPTGQALAKAYPEQMMPPNATGMHTLTIPDYFNDHNAMHEAERFIRLKDRAIYWKYGKKLDGMCSIYNSADDRTPEECIAIFEATALMRAEAFGLVLGLW